jgi:hypothetical protein
MSDKRTRAELYEVVAEAVRNTQPQPVSNTQPEPKRPAKIKSVRASASRKQRRR